MKTWPISRIRDLSDLITKGTTPTSVGFEFVPSGVNFVKVEAITQSGNFIENKLAHINADCHEALKRSQLQEGDILFSIAGALGRTAIVTKEILPANTNQALAIIRLKEVKEISRKYVFKALQTGIVFEQIEKVKGGVAQQNLSLAQVGDFEIPIPPLPEQERIVGILDEAFDGIAKAKALAEANLQNARALFQSHLQSVFSQKGEEWVETTLGASFKTVTGNTPSKSNASYFGDFMPLVKPPELLDDYIGDVADGLSKSGADVARTLPANSVLVSCIGNLGKIGINAEPVAFNQQINAILPNLKLAEPELMFFQALCSSFKQQLEDLATGTTVPIVNKSKFNEIRIVLPPIDEQLAIVENIKSLRSETQRLESLYQNKLTALDELKKSLLHQAFSGNL